MTTEKYLNIPEKIYVGFGKTNAYNKNDMLSYVTYFKKDGTIAKETSFNTWIDTNKDKLTFDNTPVDGISIVGGGGGKPRWCTRQAYCQVKDNRGFEYQITYDNLLFILSVYSYNNGTFDGMFVYAWDGPTLVLLPIVSQDYEFTLNVNEKVSYQPKDCVPGQYYTDVKSTTKDTYIFIGKYPIASTKTYDSKNRPGYHNYDILMSSVNRFIFYSVKYNRYIDTPASISSKQFIMDDNCCTDMELQQYIQRYYKETFNSDTPLKKNYKGITEFIINDASPYNIVPYTSVEDIPNRDIDLKSIITIHRGSYKTNNYIIGISKDKKSLIFFGSLYQICTNNSGNIIIYDLKSIRYSASSAVKTADELYEFAKTHTKISLGVKDQYNKRYYINADGSFTYDATRNYNYDYTCLTDIVSTNEYDIYVIQNIKDVAVQDIITKVILCKTSENININFPALYRF